MESASVRGVMMPHAGFARRSAFKRGDFFGGVLAEGRIFLTQMNTDEADKAWMAVRAARAGADSGRRSCLGDAQRLPLQVGTLGEIV